MKVEAAARVLPEAKTASTAQEARAEAHGRSSLSASEGASPANTLTMNFWPPEL